MQIQNIPEYELIQEENIEDIQSKGYFLKHKKSVTVLFLTAALIFGLMIPLVRINYNMADYLPEDAQSTNCLLYTSRCV